MEPTPAFYFDDDSGDLSPDEVYAIANLLYGPPTHTIVINEWGDTRHRYVWTTEPLPEAQ